MGAMHKIVRNLSIRTELIAVIIAFTLMPILGLSILLFVRLRSAAEEGVAAYASRFVEQLGTSVEELSRDVDTIWKQMIGIAAVSDYLTAPEWVSSPATLDSIFWGEERLGALKRSFPFIHELYLVGPRGRFICTTKSPDVPRLLSRPWLAGMETAEVPALGIRAGECDYAYAAGTRPSWVISVYSKIAPYGRKEDSILVVIDLDYGSVAARLGKVTTETGAWTIFYDDQGELLYHSDLLFPGEDVSSYIDPALAFRELTSVRGASVLVGRRVAGIGWLLGNMPVSSLAADFSRTFALYLAALAVLLASATLLSVFAAKRITRPLFEIIQGMEEVAGGNFTLRIPETGNREFVQLVRSFHRMQDEIALLLDRIALKERETAKAELAALQFQINPHFLYNTMDVLRGVAYRRGVPEIAAIAESLGNLFRYAKGGAEEDAALETELLRLADYVAIQRCRFGDRFSFRQEVEASCSGALVPRFTLQPLVENAFQHGIEFLEKGGIIRLGARREGGDLRVTVADNGPGMEASALDELRSSLEKGRESVSAGIGLANVHNRLRLRFGDRYGLHIEGGADGGLSVSVLAPFREAAWDGR